MPSASMIVAVSVLAMAFVLPCRAAEKLPAHPKLVHRQIGAGYTLALEADRREKTFFVCAPNRTDCVSTREIGWRKPYSIARSGSLVSRNYNVVDTSSANSAGPVNGSLASHLKTIPVYPASVAWEKLSPTKRLW